MMHLPTSIFPEKLREYLTARDCVAFVGAGFSIACGMPTWGTLLKGLLDEAAKVITGGAEEQLLSDHRNAWAAGRFDTAAHGIRQLLSAEELRRYLTDAFDTARLYRLPRDEQERMLLRMENLVRGPWAGIITTNYDALIEAAFDRFCSTKSPFRCDGAQSFLGSVLCVPLGAGGFFVKLHGDKWADCQVLSSEDYVRTWMVSPRVRHFLTAVMLRHRLIFIGCSLEDEVLRHRKQLWADFNAALPKAYALLPDSAANQARRRELRDQHGIETLLYPTSESEGHQTVDMFLREARNCADLRTGDSRVGRLSELQSTAIASRLAAVGAINRHLLSVLFRQPDCRLRYAYVLDPDFEQVHQGKSRPVLASLPGGERLYRLLFMVSLRLVEEHSDKDGIEYFQLTAELRTHLETSPMTEGT